MSSYLPLEGNEVTQLHFLNFLGLCLSGDESLKKRFELIGIWWRYKGMITQLHSFMDAAWNTIEPAKRQRINMVWSNQELRIVNNSQPVDPTGDMMMVPKSAVVNMAQKLQEDVCGMCLGNHNDRKDCKFRRAMLDLAIPDLRREEKRSGKCVGHLFDWSDKQ